MPWLSFVHLEKPGRPVFTEREWRDRLEGTRGQLRMHDSGTPRRRALVAEHNVNKGMELYNAELIATTLKCRHGRWPTSCAQCVWDERRNK